MDFKNSTIKQMKEFIREYNKTHSDKIKGYSKLKKADLAKFLEEYTSIKRKPQFSKKAQEKIKKTPIPGKALFSDIKGEEKILTKEEALRKNGGKTSNDLGPVGKNTDYIWGKKI